MPIQPTVEFRGYSLKRHPFLLSLGPTVGPGVRFELSSLGHAHSQPQIASVSADSATLQPQVSLKCGGSANLRRTSAQPQTRLN